MRNVVARAIAREVRSELIARKPDLHPTIPIDATPGTIYISDTDTQYELTTSVIEDTVKSCLRRHNLDRDLFCSQYKLRDSRLFSCIARTTARHVAKDRILRRVITRVCSGLEEVFRKEVAVREDWDAVWGSARIDYDVVRIEFGLTPPLLRTVHASLDLGCVFLANRNGQIVDAEFSCRGSSSEFQEAVEDAFAGKQWKSSFEPGMDLQAIGASVMAQLDARAREVVLPIESPRVSPEARQAMLVLVPMRLAEAARQRDEVEWYDDLVSSCLDSLAEPPIAAQDVIRKLFLHLFRLVLHEASLDSDAYRHYESLGKRLARLRKSDPTLPYNPVLAYRHLVLRGKPVSDGRLPSEIPKRHRWFLESAEMEQIVEAMEAA